MRKEKLVRRFASNDELRKTDPKDVEFSDHGSRSSAALRGDRDASLSGTCGIAAAERSHTYWGRWERGAPGNYIVRLTANGKSSSQP